MGSMNNGSDDEDYPSPSDGQFPASSSNVTPHIPNILIRNPTQEQEQETNAESKAREADEAKHLISSEMTPVYRASESCSPQEPRPQHSSQLGLATISPTASSGSHHQKITYSQSSTSQSSFSHRAWPTPIYAEAPPAYSPSPTPLGSAERTDYNTFGTSRIMGSPREERARLLGFQPESMGPPVDKETNAEHTRVRRSHRRLSLCFNWKSAFLVLVGLVVLLSTMRTTLRAGKKSQPQENDGSEHEQPFHPSYCSGEQHHLNTEILALDFESSRSVKFQEFPQKHRGRMPVDVGGQINVRKLNLNDVEPRMVLQLATNEPQLQVHTSLDAKAQSIKVNVPKKFKSTIPGQRPCVEMKGTIWVPENAELGDLTIDVTYLDVLLFEDLSLHVGHSTKISSVVGNINTGASKPIIYENKAGHPENTLTPAKLFSSILTDAYTTTGEISGTWPLHDSLNLHTTSGNINITITPKEQTDPPKPAMLSLSTVSGTITAKEPIHEPKQIPRRDYLVDINSISGKIEAALVFGGAITVHTTSSNMILDLLPVLNIDQQTPRDPARLETATTSGATEVEVQSPLFFDDNDVGSYVAPRVLDCLVATHTSTSSDIALRYPQSWEGALYAETTSGRLVGRGKDLQITKYTGGWPGSKMEARKGEAGTKSTITVRTLLGSMDALIGDE